MKALVGLLFGGVVATGWLAAGACLLAPAPVFAQAAGANAEQTGGSLAEGASPASPWAFQVIPYVWLPQIQGRVAVGAESSAVDVGFGQMLDLLGAGELFAAGGHFEARYDRIAFFVDAFGGTARPSTNVTIQRPRRTFTGVGDLTMNFTFVEFGPAYRVFEGPRGGRGRPITIDLLAGGRFMYFYQNLALQGIGGRFTRGTTSTTTWVDPFVGGRFAVPVIDQLEIVFRGDIGGFGAGSRLAWNLIGGLRYELPWQPCGARTSLAAIYKALDFDYEATSGTTKTDLELNLRGPALGLAFEF